MAAFVVDRKVAVGAAVGGFVSILTWCMTQWAGVVVPAEVGIGATTLLTFVAQWLVPNLRAVADEDPSDASLRGE